MLIKAGQSKQRGGATEAANGKATQQDCRTEVGQLSPSSLVGISQSEDAALET